MTQLLPVFPLSTVLFPGMTLPLHVFEERYRALVHHLLAIPEKPDRVFGVVAIREGYEVGAHGVQSVHRIGCLAQMTSVEPYADGRFDIEVVGRQRFRLEHLEAGEGYPQGRLELAEEPLEEGPPAATEAARAMAVFHRYRAALAELRGADVFEGTLPRDPTYLSYALAASCLLTLRERQALLEVTGARERLVMLRMAMVEELRAMQALPSLPATEVARTRWSPN